MTRKCWPVLALIVLLTGRMPVDSLNPWYTDKDLTFDEGLLGDWKSVDPGNKDVISFIRFVSRTKPDFYLIELIDEHGSRSEFRAHLLEIQGHHFLDVVTETWEAHSDSYAMHLTATNQGAKVEPHLLRLGPAVYLDFENPIGSGNAADLRAHLRTAHWIFRVNSDGKLD